MLGGETLTPEEPESGDESTGGLTGLHALIRAMAANPDPCRTCPHWRRCADEELACADFCRYVNRIRPTSTAPHERTPSRALYDQVFNNPNARRHVFNNPNARHE